MSFLSRVRAALTRRSPEGEAPPPESEPPPPGDVMDPAPASSPEPGPAPDLRDLPAPVKRLGKLGLPGGPTVDDAIAILRQVRGTVVEAAAVGEALRASPQLVPEPVRVACADIIAARGDERGALRVLEGVSSIPGLLLAADLYASSGQLARAVGTIERVLARDIGAPGARERHQRWSAALGYVRGPERRLDEATIVAASSAVRSPFRLLREVARGGAGTVYEAEDELLGRRIAFKVYHARGADGPLLAREARSAAALAGPGILRVFDADPAEGWLALEWIGRGSVRDVFRTGDLGVLAPIGRWARPLAHALARVHAAGLVHADVKPANVLLRHPGDPVLGDFGSARPIGAVAEGGSAGYLSPERLAGRASDPRDDVYGYGRALEDVLHRLGEAGADAGPEAEAFRALALACIGPDEARPADGAELVSKLP